MTARRVNYAPRLSREKTIAKLGKNATPAAICRHTGISASAFTRLVLTEEIKPSQEVISGSRRYRTYDTAMVIEACERKWGGYSAPTVLHDETLEALMLAISKLSEQNEAILEMLTRPNKVPV